MPKPNPELPSPAELTALHVSSLADGKASYKESDLALDHVIESLCKRCKSCGQIVSGQEITLPDAKPIPVELRGKKFRIEDKFAERNSIGAGLSVRRFEMKEVS